MSLLKSLQHDLRLLFYMIKLRSSLCLETSTSAPVMRRINPQLNKYMFDFTVGEAFGSTFSLAILHRWSKSDTSHSIIEQRPKTLARTSTKANDFILYVCYLTVYDQLQFLGEWRFGSGQFNVVNSLIITVLQ